MKIKLTRITARTPKVLAKTYSLKPDGTLKKTAGGHLIEGTAETLTIEGFENLAALIKDMETNQALVYGITEYEKARIVTKKHLKRAQGDVGTKLPVITRTRDFFKWPGAGIMPFDFDGVKADHADKIYNLLVELHPALEKAPVLIFPSSSSGLYYGEKCLKGLNGWRALVLVADASDIPRTGETLFKLSWLQEHGFIFISESGAQLVRSPLDGCVWQEERLDFVGGANCLDGIEERRPEPALYNKDMPPLDTRTIKSLTTAETLKYDELVFQAKADTRTESKERRDAWEKVKFENECKKFPEVDPDQIRKRIERASRHRYLDADYALETLDGDPLTPEDILKNREKWHLQYIKDPFDAGARPRARVFTMNGGKAYIFSFSEMKRYYLTITRKNIEISPGNRCDAVGTLIRTAREAGDIFSRGGEVVTMADSGAIKPLDTPALQFKLDGLFSFSKYDARSKKAKPADCPKNYAEGFGVSARLDGGLPELKGIITHPTLDPKTGRIIDRDGYDAGTGLLLQLNGDEWPTVPGRPTKDQIVNAVTMLLDPFSLFPFSEPVDRGVFFAELLTAVLRPLLGTAPLSLHSAPEKGTGKTLLAQCTGRIIGIKFPSLFSFGGLDETETRKRLFSIFRQGARLTILDNLKDGSTLVSETLCAALTSPTLSDRILSASTIATAPTNTLIIATGNNVRPGGDLCRRTVTVRLDAGLENPWTRTFDENILDRLDRDRIKLVTAALTILKGTLSSGFTARGGLGSFEDWNHTARAAVCYAASLGFDVADPVKSIEASLGDDPDAGKLRALLTAWDAVFQDTPTTVAGCITAANEDDSMDFDTTRGTRHRYPALYDACDAIAGERGNLNVRRLAHWIAGHRDRVIEGLFFQLTEVKTRGLKHWAVKTKF